MLTEEFQPSVAQHGPGKKAKFQKHLEAIADPKYQSSLQCKFPYFLHQRRKLGDGTRPQIIPIRKTAGKDNAVHTS